MFEQSPIQIVGRTNLKSARGLARGFTLQNVEETHRWTDGRLVGTRTPDLYRVKAAFLCTANNLKGFVGSFHKHAGQNTAERHHDGEG
jgi:hypothetical protein